MNQPQLAFPRKVNPTKQSCASRDNGSEVGSIAGLAASETSGAAADPARASASAGPGSSPGGNPHGNGGRVWCKPDGDTSSSLPHLKQSCVRVLVALAGIGGTGDAWACLTRLGPMAQRAEVSKRLGELADAGYVQATGTRMGPRRRPVTLYKLTGTGWRAATEAAA